MFTCAWNLLILNKNKISFQNDPVQYYLKIIYGKIEYENQFIILLCHY
jgi:beta-glucosidase/6-phospho-beta-glucosidase/beta-galactosidase